MRRRFIWVLGLILCCAFAALLASRWADRHPGANSPISSTARYSHASFKRWLAEAPERKKSFTEFEAYLAARGVSGTVPNWQLLRTDMNDRIGCPRPAFLLPPRKDWPAIVPVLALLKREIVPRIGPVEVMSSYRTEAFNACVGGAGHSRHMAFAAVDLVAALARDSRTLFRDLCTIHGQIGRANRFGLGAYFDPAKPKPGPKARFHIDASGFRSWGGTKHAGSSGCRFFD